MEDPALVQIKEVDIKPFTYDFKMPNIGKNELYVRARDYIATVYGDSRSVIRVQDQENGTIIGKGVVDWRFKAGSLIQCSSNYNIRFMAKDYKARLQLELIKGAAAFSRCKGWKLPTVTGYNKIKVSFDSIAQGVEKAIKGEGSIQKFKDF